MRAAIEKGIDALKAAGCAIKRVSLPHTRSAVPTYYLVATAEASANLARFDGVRYGYRSPQSATLSDMYSHSRDEGFGAEVKRRILLGTYALSAGYYDAYYRKAQQVRALATLLVERDKALDVIGGAAGCALALRSLHRCRPSAPPPRRPIGRRRRAACRAFHLSPRRRAARPGRGARAEARRHRR